jgi:hypothetical protein
MFDVMDCEQNLAVNILKTILGEKDTKKVWHNFQALGICQFLWLKPHRQQKSSESIMPIAPWVMPKENWAFFLDTMAKLKLPIGYAFGFKKHIIKGKFGAIKSHDYNVLFQ